MDSEQQYASSMHKDTDLMNYTHKKPSYMNKDPIDIFIYDQHKEIKEPY